jgi:hypothetical protein
VELIHIRLEAGDLARRAEVVVMHSQTGRDEVLEVGQQLVVSDLDGEFHGAEVIAVGGDGADPAYHLRIGARLPVDIAAQRLTDTHTQPENAGVQEVVDLLGELRRLFGGGLGGGFGGGLDDAEERDEP